MPSEAQSQEPRDRGPPPPVTRAGRSAQLAKAAATCPASDRRTRGRPRKDGSCGRSGPPAPAPAPPPPPPPPPKSRKKGRSRGQAQVEDEESMDTTEKKPLHRTEVKEKTTGCRRFTSRRKSNTNSEPDPEPDPESSRDRLTPEPEPDPDPSPSDPSVPTSSPGPAPSAQEEDRTSPGPVPPVPAHSPGPVPSPGEDPGVGSPSPDLSPVHRPTSSPRPDPSPMEEVWPSPSLSPAPIEVDCSPSRGPEEPGGASPMEPSPGSSPPVSPCLRLEDEDSLSSLFQRSLSEDSGGSPTPSLRHTKKRLKQCAFCYCGDRPPLGQGRLVVFGPTPGYIPLHILSRRASSDRDSDCHDHCYRGDQALPTCSSPDQCEDESSSEFFKQLGPIGLPPEINVQSLFDPTGQCCAHLQCAAWSEGVCRGEGQSLLYVDKAIDSGSTQVCVFCRRLGASLRCQETDCGRSYHFPCAAAAGAHQDWNQRHTLCTRHTHTVFLRCVSCSGRAEVGGLLMCCCCGNRYHGSCLDPPLAPSPLCRAGWQCPECRACQSCRLRGDEGVLLVCERCDKSYHSHCLTPPLDLTPSTGWICKNCRVCRRCGVRSSGLWANHPFLCESCDPALPCPLCGHAPDLYAPQEYLTCICCYRCVHAECILQAGEGRAGSESYVCSTCRPQEEELIPHTPITHSPTHAPPTSISQPPVPSHTEAPPISPTAHSPVLLICSEPSQSPTKMSLAPSTQICTHPDPTELQQSHPPSPTENQQIPASSPMELQQSSPSSPTENQQIPASSPMERQQSSPSSPTENQQIPAPSPMERQQSFPSSPTGLKQSPKPCLAELQQILASSPTELQKSHPTSPTENQQIPAPSPTEPEQSSPSSPTGLRQITEPFHTELQHISPSSPTELQQSHPTSLTDLQKCTARSPTGFIQSPGESSTGLIQNLAASSTEVQQRSSSANTGLKHSPAPSPSELQQNPAPSPSELQQSSAPSPSELQKNPAPSPTELEQSPEPCATGHLQIPAPPLTELQQRPPPSLTEAQQTSAELLQVSAATHSNQTELQQRSGQSHPVPAALGTSPLPSCPDPAELPGCPSPSHHDCTEQQKSHTPPHLSPGKLQPTECEKSPSPSLPGPAELYQSYTHVTSTQAQQSPLQLSFTSSSPIQNSTEDQPMATDSQQSPSLASPISCMFAHPPHSPQPHSGAYTGLSPTRVQAGPAEPQHSPTPCNPSQDNTTQVNRSFSPTNMIVPQHQQSPAPHSPAHVGTSPPQSLTQDAEPALDQKSPGSSSPAHVQCTAAQDISTLDQDLSLVCCRSTKVATGHAILRPISAPCSPSPFPVRPRQCSLSQPASPVQVRSTLDIRPLQLSLPLVQVAALSTVTMECTQTSTEELKSLEQSPMQCSFNIVDQTLESSPAPLSPISDLSTMPPKNYGADSHTPDHTHPRHVPALPTPESLVHISSSVEHSSLTCSLCADETERNSSSASNIRHPSPCDSSSLCTEAFEKASPPHIQASTGSASPTHASQMPSSATTSQPVCVNPIPDETSLAPVGPLAAEMSPSTQSASLVTLTQPVSPLAPLVRSLTGPPSCSAVLARPVHPASCQDEEMEGAVGHQSDIIRAETSSNHLDSPTPATPVHTEANSGCILTGSVHAQERTSVCSFSTPTSCSPPHCTQTGTSPASSPVSRSLSSITSDFRGQLSPRSASGTEANIIHSPTRSSPAGQASPVHIVVAHSGPLQTQTPSLARTICSSPAHATVTCVSPFHSPAQASDTPCSPRSSPLHCTAPDTGTSTSLTAAQPSPTLTSLDVDMTASPTHQSSVLSGVVWLDTGLVKLTNCIRQTSPTSASCLPDESSAVSPNQASLSQVSKSPAGSPSAPDGSSVKSQQNTAWLSPLYRRPDSPVDATSTQASPSHASPVHSSATQDNTALPSTSHTSKTPSQLTCSDLSEVSYPQTVSTHVSCAHSRPVQSPVQNHGLVDSSYTPVLGSASPVQPEWTPGPSPGLARPLQPERTSGPVSPVQPEPSPSPGPVSPVQPEPSPSPGPISPVQPEPSPNPGPVSPVHPEPSPGPVSPVQPEPSPGPVSPVQPDPSPGPVGPVQPEPSPGPVSPVQPDPIPSPGPVSPVQPDPIPSPGPVSPVQPDPIPSPGPISSVQPDPIPSPGPVSPVKLDLSPGPVSPVQPEPSPSPGPVNPVQQEPSPGPGPVSPVQPDPSPSPGPVSPVQPEPSPGPVSPLQLKPSPHADSASPVQLESSPCPGLAGPVQQELSPRCDPASPMRCEASSDLGPASPMLLEVSPSLTTFGQPETSGPVQPTAGPDPGCCSDATLKRRSPTEAESAVDISTVEEIGALQGMEDGQEHLQTTQEEEAARTEGGGRDQEEEYQLSSSNCPHSGLQVPPLLPSSSPPPPPEDQEPVNDREDDKISVDDSSQSQSLFEPVAEVTEPTKDEHQSHAEPSEEEEEEQPIAALERAAFDGGQPISERGEGDEDQSDVEEEPVSPVLDLDASLDMEVMELMSSSPPPSLLHLSSPSSPPRRGKGRTLRPPPCSTRPVDDLSIRLRQSPFSTEASPETSPSRPPVTPPPLSPPSPPLRSSPPARETPPLSKLPAPPPTVLFPLTLKIGMGKPAISKRKFSPGRARLKQGSWWSSRWAVSPPSSSQDSTGEAGWDSPKPRPPDSPVWSMRVGRGSGFPGRRRSRGGLGGGRGGRGRSRLKTQDSRTLSQGCAFVETFQPKEEEENSMHNTVVMFSTSDHFTLRQDMCVVCGSFGQGAEGRLLACSQCGQCYHPYCVNVKITRVVLTKGWRCLECTVCEACGEASDPGRLLLCDDCDISYHTYCLDPPLHTVPKGAWKCKWCVWCVQCGSASPGLHCDWQSNYSLCGPCCSLSRCPLCHRRYSEDELVLQCQQCDRWVHAVCQGLTTEDEVEFAADEGFDCSLCKSHGRSSFGSSDSMGPYMAQIISRISEHDTKTYTQDGVCLTESGLSHLQSLVEPLTSPRRYRRCKPKLKLRIINQNSVSVLQTPPDPEPPTDQDPSRGDLECDMKSDSSPERDHAHDNDVMKEPEVTDGNKKRKRKPYRPGIGGFMVRQRGGKAGPSRIKLCRKDSSKLLLGRDEGLVDADVAMEMAPPADQMMEKVKKRYRKKKTKLEEAFPSYLQEAFFGRDLLDRSRQVDRRAGPETPGGSQPGATTGDVKDPLASSHGPSPTGQPVGAMATTVNRKQGVLPMSEDALLDLSDVLNTDPHILATGHTAGLDNNSMDNDLSLTSDLVGSGRGQRAVQEEPLDAILSPELDKMVTDGAILSKLYNIPELEGKDVEEVFTAVLSPNSSNNQQTHTAAGGKTHTRNTVFPRLPLLNGLMPAAPPFPSSPIMPGGTQAPASFRLAPVQGPAPGSAPASQTSSGNSEQDTLSTAQRGMLKWEKEESLGERATVAPVLYCNTNYPQLRQQYPDWTTRVKQITKLWRKASSQDRAPYVQKARDNRAAQRINKVQLSNDTLKRHQASQPAPPAPPPGPYDPVYLETEVGFKDPLRPKESEQEQEWKLRQQMRQKSKQLAKIEATQKLEQVKNEQRQLLANQHPSGSLSPDSPAPQPVAGGNASPLPPREGPPRRADDVFLRPQAPPPSGFSSLPHSPLPSSPLHQPPSSPQMFSPPSSRPSSPWDPYGKVVGTPRPTGAPPPQQQQRRNSLSASPAHEAAVSPAPSPDSKTSDRPQPGLQQSRGGVRPVELFQRFNRPGELGSVFKAPMPPQQEGGRREVGFSLPQEAPFPSSPLSGLGSPNRSPYAPRPDYGQQVESFSPLSPYANPQTPGTPRPHSDPAYLPAPPALRLDQFSQQPPGRRPSPSHPALDPYASNPGTPRPSDRFPRSPGAQPAGMPRPSPDPYAQQPSTPRAHKAHESYGQSPPESFIPQPAGSGSSPLVPGEPGTFTAAPHQLQQSPGRQQQDSFPRTPSGQTPKHAGMAEAHDPFEQGHMTPGPMQTDDVPVGGASLDGPMSMLPQLGDSEEKLRQRQRLRQLILRQQQQKSALRQEKGLQETAPPAPSGPPAPPGSATPRHSWSQEDSSTALPSDPFGRPPPPYPGTVQSGGAPGLRFPGGFPGKQQRGFSPSEGPFPRQSLPRELGVRGPALRFGVPPGAPAGLEESFLRPPQGPMPASGPAAVEGVPVQMRRPTSGELTGIRPLAPPNAHPLMMPGVPQPFLPRSLPLQQHSIMGQPYIELRHRAPENRLRLPFPSAPDPEAPLLHPRDPQGPVRPGAVVRMADALMGQPMAMAGGVEQVNQQHGGEAALQGADGMEEHLEGEDSAVKDLEDVEVKDLVDLNLNLDPEDGKEDLDLGPNDLHLDDFLLSGKFDLIAYADPELNLEDKKDMFNEELDLGEPAEDKEGAERRDGFGGARRSDGPSLSQVKQEAMDDVKTETWSSSSSGPLGPPGAPGPAMLLKDHMEDSSPGALPALQAQEESQSVGLAPRGQPPLAAGQQSSFQQQQRSFGPSSSSSVLLTQHPQGLPVSPHPSLPPKVPPGPPHPPPPQPRLLLSPQPPQPGTSTQNQNQAPFSQGQTKDRPLLLEEQPLLLQDLLDQERQEQQQQKQMQVLIRQRSGSDSVFPGMDFDSISDPIMKAKMVALKGINKVMTQGSLGLNPMVMNRFQEVPGAPDPEGPPQPPRVVGQDGKVNPQLVRPSPPSFGPGFVNESQRRQYEEWLGETQQLLGMQQRLLEEQIAAHRKTKKALSAKQRTAKRAGRMFADEDAAQLRYISEQQGAVQKQLEQIRKQQKDHAELIDDYRTKQQQQRAPPIVPAPPHSLLAMQPHPASPAPPRVPGVPPGWTPGGGAPGVMVQRMPPHLPPQMPPALPSAPQGPPRGPAGGPIGAGGDGATPTPQVKFDDNNPFSEGFQERERRERLREQQERQRVQLMQEVERHRALQQRLELEQQALLEAPMGLGSGALSGARVGSTPGPGPGGPAGSTAAPGDGLSQMPFFSSELPQDFLQSPPAPRPQLQAPAGPPFPQQKGLHKGFKGPLHPGAHPAPGLLAGATAEWGRAVPEHGPPLDVAPSDVQMRPRLPGLSGASAQGLIRLAGVGGLTPSQPHRYGHDSSSSSPTFPCPSPGGPASLIQLYSDIIPDDKPKKKRSRKRDGDDASHSDYITAPPTSAVSDTSCSTPSHGSVDQSHVSFPQSSSRSALAPSSELERQLSVSSAAQQRASILGMEGQGGPLCAARLEVKEEREEGGACGAGVVKVEEGGVESFSSSSPPQGGDGGKELLRHLLKDNTSPATTPSPTGQAPPTDQAPPISRHQLSNDSLQSEDEDRPGSHGNTVSRDSPGPDLLDPSGRKKAQRCKRLARPDKNRAPPKYKRRKKEEEEKTLHSSTSSSDPLMTHLRQLSVLPLMEPVLGVDLSLFPPYGSSPLGSDSRLMGSFGSASLDGVTDYYSQLIYKNNLSNPPTPPASLPPTPPPVARQKLVNGFASTEELDRKDMPDQEGKGVSALKQKGEELMAVNHASKTVDVPASLPTPPHNNQEELRAQDLSERGSPDGFVPSSSPESIADMEVSRYPDLSFIKLESPSPCPSPTLPIMPCAWGKGSAVKQEVKAEPIHHGRPSCSNTDLVTIAITLNPVAAQSVAGVMAAVAELLRVPVPVDYRLSRAAGPEQSSLALLAGVRVPLPQVSTGSGQQRPAAAAANTGVRMDYIQQGGAAAAAARPQCCSYCKVLLGNGVRIVKELKQEGRPSLVFCSPNCSSLYTADVHSSSAGNKAEMSVLQSGSEHPPASRGQHQYTNNMSSIAVHSLPHTPSSSSSSSSPPLSFPPASAVTMETRPRVDSLKVKVKLKPRPRAVPGGEDSQSPRHGKRMKSCRWRRWGVSITLSRGPCIPNEAVAMPTEEEVDMLLKKLGACLRPEPLPKDQRRCCFCHQQGDGQTDGPARLLNLDLDLWVHLNCALWSSEVYETQAGALINVELALRRGLTLRCAYCQQTGATSGCNRLRCTNTYHFTCALQAHCTFFKDKTMLCHFHKPRAVPLSGDRSSSGSPSSTPGPTPDPAVAASDPYNSELRCFSVFRRVFVQRDEARQIAAVVQRGERQHTFRVGSLLFRAVGRLLPHQMSNFHNETAIFPVGYHANRIYWSMRHSNRRCKYMCYVEEKEGEPLFRVKVVEKGHDDLILTGPTPKAVWEQILEPVSQMRSSTGTLKLFPVYLKGEDLFGLSTSAVTRIIESLPGVEACERYTFRFGRNPLMEWPLAFNPSGSARSEPKAYQAKRPYLLTSIAPRCQGSVGSIVGLVPGVISLAPGESMAGAHQGRHSKSSQYRRMKAEWKSNVYLARSRIQGLGLYAARDIEKCTMVIEYIGTIIRSEVANRKERLYESQNRGVYMFRIDNDYVIDATITGGPARYINHSCAPNCITEVVTVEKENKIVISSCRRIQRGEELSYDYKFDLEDDQHKIPCHCGAMNCRKWMN